MLTVVDRPLLGLHVLLLLVLVGTGYAGWWQWEAWRGEQRDDTSARLAAEPVPLADALGPDDPLANEDDGVVVEVVGRYAPREQQFLVSGRAVDDVDGFWVLSPLEVTSTGSVLLVVRGWVDDPELPTVPGARVTEVGVLQPGEPGSGAVDASRVLAAVRIPALANEVDTDLYDGYLVRTAGPAADGLVPVEPRAADPSWSAGLRNLAYALQWWLFAGFGVFLWWHIRADRLSVASAE